MSTVEIVQGNAIMCKNCTINEALIFQENGDYCLDCWQDICYQSFQ